MSARRLLSAGCLALALTSGCAPSAPPLQGAVESREALGRAVVERVAARDVAGLRQLMLTRDEFAAHVWPHLPTSRPGTNMPMAFVWNRLRQQSEGRLAQVVSHYGGTTARFVEITTRGETTTYGDVVVHRDSRITLQHASGDVEQVELFGSVVRQGSRWKVFSYVTD